MAVSRRRAVPRAEVPRHPIALPLGVPPTGRLALSAIALALSEASRSGMLCPDFSQSVQSFWSQKNCFGEL